MEMDEREQSTNAKLEATLKKKTTLDLEKHLEEDQATQQVVAPKNMKELVNALVNQWIDQQGQQKQKAQLKAMLKGGDKAANPTPGKQYTICPVTQ